MTASCAACSVSSRRATRSRISISRRVCSSSRSRSVGRRLGDPRLLRDDILRALLLQRLELRRQRFSFRVDLRELLGRRLPHLGGGHQILADLPTRATRGSAAIGARRKYTSTPARMREVDEPSRRSASSVCSCARLLLARRCRRGAVCVAAARRRARTVAAEQEATATRARARHSEQCLALSAVRMS